MDGISIAAEMIPPQVACGKGLERRDVNIPTTERKVPEGAVNSEVRPQRSVDFKQRIKERAESGTGLHTISGCTSSQARARGSYPRKEEPEISQFFSLAAHQTMRSQEDQPNHESQ